MTGKSRFHIIIQARMTSSRLPGKVLLPLCGRTVLEVIFERLSKYKRNIIVATTNDGTEKPIVEICRKNNIKYFCGEKDNVLKRYHDAAVAYKIDYSDVIVRVTSDCPLVDMSLLEKCVSMYQTGKFDYVSNRINRTVPIGLDIEVFGMDILRKVYERASRDYEKEHVTPYIYLSNSDEFLIGSCEESDDSSMFRLTLDEDADYEAIKTVYGLFDNKIFFSYSELIDLLRANPELQSINGSVLQKPATG